MSDANNNAASGEAAGQQNGNGFNIENILKLLNNPLLVNAGLGAFMYWAFDPKGIRQTLDEMCRLMGEQLKVSKEQREEIRSLKKQVARLSDATADDEDDFDDDDLHGAKKKKRKRAAFLD